MNLYAVGMIYTSTYSILFQHLIFFLPSLCRKLAQVAIRTLNYIFLSYIEFF